MSITLITAVPGGGKTAHVVWNVIRPACEKQRVVYCNAIPELKLPVIKVTRDQVKAWSEREAVDPLDPEGVYKLLNFQEGALIVADEIQYLWPTAGSREPPEDIKYLTQHRKHGLDFVLITQSPHLVHSHVLQVVDKHIHIVPTWSGRKMYEWPEYCANPKHRTNQQNAVKTQYKIPAEAFPLYYSATQHTKVERRIPFMLWFAIFIFIFIPVMVYASFDRINQKLASQEQSENDTSKENTTHNHQQDNTQTVQAAPVHVVHEQTIVTEPKLPTILTNEYDWSKVGACITGKSFGCVCYDSNAQRLLIPLETCQLAVKYGWTKL
ncbi:MAG: zonular occludens toxin [Nitrosomonas sp.]|nr:zonular occludens toxin [Nitrosomonas sp.]